MSLDWKKRSTKGYGRKISPLDKIRACEMLAKMKENELAGTSDNIEDNSEKKTHDLDEELSDYERIRAKNIKEKQSMLTAMQNAANEVKDDLKICGKKHKKENN